MNAIYGLRAGERAVDQGEAGLENPDESGKGYERREGCMPGVKVREAEPFENALRRFKKQCEKAGVLSEIRKREYYEKPSVKRKRKAIAAKKKAAKARILLGA